VLDLYKRTSSEIEKIRASGHALILCSRNSCLKPESSLQEKSVIIQPYLVLEKSFHID
ncbi:7442_t:CDS:2, partial [Cetraspora pellucida]